MKCVTNFGDSNLSVEKMGYDEVCFRTVSYKFVHLSHD